MQAIKGIDLIEGSGPECNIYIVDDEFIIDTGTGKNFYDTKNKILDAHKIDTIKSIINTHYHFDHTGGNKKFRDWLRADINVHELDREFVENGEVLSEMFNEKPVSVTVNNALKEGDIIKTKSFRLEVIHTPGHSPGSICLYDRAKRILISGDMVFSDSIGRTDLPNGDRKEMKKSLKKLTELNIKYLFPGHGQPMFSGADFHIKQMFNRLDIK